MSLLEIKKYLHIEHNHDDTVLERMLASAIQYCQFKVSKEFDVSGEMEKEFLKERVRYAYNQVLEEFEKNFISEILTLQLMYADKEQATPV